MITGDRAVILPVTILLVVSIVMLGSEVASLKDSVVTLKEQVKVCNSTCSNP
jgi:hypothetical protein